MLYLTTWEEDVWGARAWKLHACDALDRVHTKAGIRGTRSESSGSFVVVLCDRKISQQGVGRALLPLLRVIDALTREIELYDKLVSKKAETEYPQTKAIRTIHELWSQ